jgi:putative transposase
MVRYRRILVAGGTFFFTVTLVDRRSSALVDHINALRAAVRATRAVHPFTIDAIVVLLLTLSASVKKRAGNNQLSSV